MALKLWMDNEFDGDWNTAANWEPVGVPQAGDSVYFDPSDSPDTPSVAPSAPIALASFDTSGLLYNIDNTGDVITGQISIQAGGTLKIGGPGGTHRWYGDAKLAGTTIDFYACTENWGDLGLNIARFHNDAKQAGGIAAGVLYFYDTSRITGGILDSMTVHYFASPKPQAVLTDGDSVLSSMDSVFHIYNLETDTALMNIGKADSVGSDMGFKFHGNRLNQDQLTGHRGFYTIIGGACLGFDRVWFSYDKARSVF